MTFTYFTEAELRALPDMINDEKYPTARLQAAHDWIVAIVERLCETSFVVTTVTDARLTGGDREYLRLPDAYVRTVTAITADGLDYDINQIAGVTVEDGYLYASTGAFWPSTSRGNVVVSYTRGWSTVVPADLKEAMLRAARQWVLTTAAWSGADSRSTSISNQYGNVQLSVASEDHPTGIPDVDATIMGWAARVRVPKVR